MYYSIMQNNTIRIIWNLISAQVLGSINFGSGKKNKAILYLPFCAKKRFQTQCNCSNCLLTSRPLKNTHHFSGKKPQQTYVAKGMCGCPLCVISSSGVTFCYSKFPASCSAWILLSWCRWEKKLAAGRQNSQYSDLQNH